MLVGYGDQGMPLAGAGCAVGGGVRGHRVRRRRRPVHRRRQVVRRAGPRAAAPAPAGVAARGRAGDLKAWRARRIADRTLLLSQEAAAFVDAHVAPTAHKIGPYQLHALVEQAIAEFMPDLAEERQSREGRRPVLHRRGPAGLLRRHRERARRTGPGRRPRPRDTPSPAVAAQLKDLGSDESLDVRRALAVGELARRQPTLDLNPTSVEPVETNRGTQRQVVLYVHLTDAALHGAAGTARLERGNSQVTAGQVRDWCHTAGRSP